MTAADTTNLRYGAKHRTAGYAGWYQGELREGCRTALPRSGRQEIAFLFRLLLKWISFIASVCGNVIGQCRILTQLAVQLVTLKLDTHIKIKRRSE